MKTSPDYIDDFQPGPYAVARHRSEMPCYSRMASGDIYPSRFVTLSNVLGRVRQSLLGDAPYGISQAETRGSPYRPSLVGIETRAAADGESVFVFGPYAVDVSLVYGGIVAIGDRLTSDSQGRGIKATTGTFYLAIAQEPGNLGDVRKATTVTPQRLR
jgi:hypothetical protein